MKKNLLRASIILMMMSSFTFNATAALIVPQPADSSATKPDATKLNEALAEFKSLPKSERKERVREAKKLLKQYRSDKRSGKAEADTNTILLAILAILLPPLAVYLKEGEINNKFWLSLILTLLFWIPGVIYALLVVFDVV